jgi:hypothetical protein
MSAKKKHSEKIISEQIPDKKVSKAISIKLVWLITCLFFVVSIFGILHHEMWRDELQSWMVARDSHTLVELYKNCTYEGHPLLWYILLFIINIFTASPVSMQILNVCLGTIFIFLFIKYSGFSLLQCVLFAFGYYTLFEFTQIARSYNLELVLMAIFCVLYNNAAKNMWLLFIVLILLANTSAFGLLFAVGFAALYYFDIFFKISNQPISPISPKKVIGVSLLFLVGIISSIIQIKPEKGNLVSTDIASLFDFDQLETIVSRVYNAFFLLPDLSLLPHWNFSGTMRLDSQNVPLYFLFSCIVMVCSVLIFYRRPFILFLFLILTAGVILISDLAFLISARYVGRIFIAFIILLWLAKYFPLHQYKNGIHSFLNKLGEKIEPIFILLVLSVQVIAGILYFNADYRLPFSGSEEAASYIKLQKLDTVPIVGSQDYAVSPLAALLNKDIFYPESKTFGSFIVWDNNLRKHQNPDFDIVFAAIDSVIGSKHKNALLILNALPSGPEGKLEHAFVTPKIKLDLIHQSENSMVADEYYYIYLATKVK